MGLYRRFRNLLRRNELDSDLERELNFHLSERVDDLVASGMTEKDAWTEARRRFGNFTIQKERTRAIDLYAWVESVGQDLRYGWRVIHKNSLFAVIVVLSLGIGIGANATLFSLIDAILIRKLPLNGVDELVYLQWAARSNWLAGSTSGTTNFDEKTRENISTSFAYPAFRVMRSQAQTLDSIFSYAPLYQATVSSEGQPDLLPGQLVSGNYFSALRVAAVAGRVITDEDDRAANPVAVISYRYWERRFGGKPDTVGKPIVVNGSPLTIIGVTPADFPGLQGFGTPTDISIPMGLVSQINPCPRCPAPTEGWYWWVRILGRIKPGVTTAQVQGELETIFRNEGLAAWRARPVGDRRPEGKELPRLEVLTAARGLQDGVYEPKQLFIPMAGITLTLLLIVCLNIANLMLARSAVRRSELSVRLAIGGSRARLMRQLLTESVLLSAIGGGLGLAVAYWGQDLLTTFVLPKNVGAFYDLHMDPAIILFVVAASLVVGILMGLVPALRATGRDIHPTLKESSRVIVGQRARLNKALLVAQVALSMILLVGAGMLVRSLHNLRSVDVGFDPNNLLLFRISPQALKYDDARVADIYQRVADGILTLAGAKDVTLLQFPLVGTSGSRSPLEIMGRDNSAASQDRLVNVLYIRPNLFKMLKVPILMGRDLDIRDDAGSPRVALINETLAKRMFSGQNPVGARVRLNSQEIEIAGVVKDLRTRVSRENVGPAIFMPYLQNLPPNMTFMVRSSVDPTRLINPIREAVRQIDANLPIYGIETQNEQIENGFVIERMFASAAGFFGSVALLLASIGLYGLMSYSVERRTNEFGVRMALGASPSTVVQLVMWQTFILVFVGIALGFAASAPIGHAIASMRILFKVEPGDALSYAIAIGTMTAVACLAAWLPARRAARVDPSVALRYE